MKLGLPIDPPGRRVFDVVGLGLNSIDLLGVVPEYPPPNTKQRLLRHARLPGGQVATAMVTCARLGLRAKYLGKVGSDEFGRLAIESLVQEGVDTSGIIVEPDATTQFAFILIDARTGDRTICWHRHERLAFRPEEVDRAAIEMGRWLHLDCHEVAASTAAAQIARDAGIPVSIDIEYVREGTDQLLQLIDVVVAAEDFPASLTGASDPGEGLARLEARYQPALAVVTLGRDGSLARCRGREIRTPGFAVDCVDSTGAGDVFRGGLICGLIDGWAVEESLGLANAVAALKCRRFGAREGIPTLAEARKLLQM